MNNTVTLLTESILQVPIENYQKDFTFIVNDEEFQTTRLVADLISTQISKIHQIDPTLSEYSINTESNGNFQHFLDILDFNTRNIEEAEIPFFSEIIELLGTEKIKINITTPEISKDNVIELISKHQKQPIFYSNNLLSEIDFLSSHFYEIVPAQTKEFHKIRLDIIEQVVNNKKLELESEDQLLGFINQLFAENPKYSNLYECVYFRNVSSKSMNEFISIFDIEYLTQNTWLSLARKLSEEENENENEERKYHQNTSNRKTKNQAKGKEIPFSNNQLEGIFSYLRENSNDILDEVEVDRSSVDLDWGDDRKVLDIQCEDNDFFTGGAHGTEWISFEFKNHKIIPSNYTIRSFNGSQQLRSWVIECLNDKQDWTKIDEQNDSTSLKGENVVHTFAIQSYSENNEPYKYIRIRQTKNNWDNTNIIDISSIEFYGILI